MPVFRNAENVFHSNKKKFLDATSPSSGIISKIVHTDDWISR